MQVTVCTCSDTAALHNQARLLAAHQACSLLKFLTHALGMLLRPVIYPSRVSSEPVDFSGSRTAASWESWGAFSNAFVSHLRASPSHPPHSPSGIKLLKQSDCVRHVSGRFQSWSAGLAGVWALDHCASVDQSTLNDPGQMWGPITLQTVISGSRSSLQRVTQSRCWNGNDKSALWGVEGGFLWENVHKCKGTDPACKEFSKVLYSIRFHILGFMVASHKTSSWSHALGP